MKERIDRLNDEITRLRRGLELISAYAAQAEGKLTSNDRFERGYANGLAKAGAVATEWLKPENIGRRE